MSNAPDDPPEVPDDTSYGGLSAAFWALMVVIGLALFVWEFGGETLTALTETSGGSYPIRFIGNLKLTLTVIEIVGGGGAVAVIGYVVYRYGAKRDPPDRLNPGEGKYTLTLYSVGLVFLLAMTIFMGASTLAQTDQAQNPQGMVSTDRTLHMGVVGSQWVWRMNVEGVPYTQSEKLVVPANTLIKFNVTSADVIHSFAIQKLGIKKDAIPGQMNTASFLVKGVNGEATLRERGQTYRADTYQINCAELCGKGHSKMYATMYVLSPNDYRRWVSAQNGSVPASFNGSNNNSTGGA